jgi:thymidylate kinase
MRRLGVAEQTRALPAWTDWDTIGFPGHGFVLFHLLVARDRRRMYRLARRAADQGTVVVSDRFPLPGIELMDGPRTPHLPGLERRPLARWLSALEVRCYRAIDPPDLLVVLRVDPEVAVARRPEQDPDFVRRRAGEVWTHDWTSTDAVVVDASQPSDAVLDQVHQAIWAAM